MSFAMHKQVHPPTGVDHACAAYFTHPIGDGAPPNLVVTQANHLTVFAIRRESSAAGLSDAALGAAAVARAKAGGGGGETRASAGPGGEAGTGAHAAASDPTEDEAVSLEVVAEFDLHGAVGSIAVLRRRFGAPRSQRDALMIAVRESKLSVVEFDPATLSLVSSSLHSWETPVGSGGVPSALRVAPLPPRAAADPEGRCGAVLLRAEGKTRLARLPAVEADIEGDDEDASDDDDHLDGSFFDGEERRTGDGDAGDDKKPPPRLVRTQSEIRARGAAASVRESYVVDLTKTLGIWSVRDVAFLHGYGEPTLLVLHERAPTWAARTSLVADTCAVSAVSLDLFRRKHVVIWQRTELPHTSYRLCAMPDPLGGALVISQNFVAHESQDSSRALALNPLAGGDLVSLDPAAMKAAKAAAEAAALATTSGNAAALDPSLANPPAALARRAGTESAVGVSVELDSAHAAAVSERQVLLTTKQGALMLLTLKVEGRRLAERGAMALRRAGGAVLSSGMCLITPRLLFLGSRVGDSLLVSLKPKQAAKEAAMLPAPAAPPAAKRRKTGESSEASAAAVPHPDPGAGRAAANPPPEDDDELEAMLYGEGEGGGAGRAADDGGTPGKGSTAPSLPGAVSAEGADGVGNVGAAALRAAAKLGALGGAAHSDPGYAFTVRDSVLGMSPVIDLTVGAAASVAGDVEARSELVAACGHGKNGALAVLQRGIQPELVTEVEAGTLPGLRGTWTVHRAAADADDAEDDEAHHAYLVIALASATMVLETGEELKEVSEAVDLVSDATTLAAGNVWGRRRIAQAHPGGVRVCDGAKKTQDVAVGDLSESGDGVVVVAAQVCDPYVLLRLSDGTARLLRGAEVDARNDGGGGGFELRECGVSADARGAMAADVASVLTLVSDATPAANHPGLANREPGFLRRATRCPDESAAADASDLVLLAAARNDGGLEIRSLPSGRLAWAAEGLSDGARTLAPAGSRPARELARERARAASGETAGGRDSDPPRVVELRLDAFAAAHERPMLTALRADGSVLVYRAFLCPPGAGGTKRGDPPQLRMARVPVEVEGGGLEEGVVGTSGAALGGLDDATLPGTRLTRFERVGDRGGVRGVFVSGAKPLWLLARRSRVLALPTRGEASAVVSFTPFHNVNCPNGFILGTAAGGARICRVPGRMHYEAAWPVRKLALKCTPHHVQYLPDFRLYALCTSAPVRWKEPAEAEAETDMHGAMLLNTRRAKAMAQGGVEERFALRLLVPGSLECAWQHAVAPGEHVQTIRNVRLRNARTGAMQSMLAVGTAWPGGEDTPCRGRILLFDVVWQMTEDGTQWQGRLACAKEAKMACTALSGLEGSLVVAIGTKLIAHSWDGENLTPNAFFDTPLHTVTINTVKNFILLGDLQKGAHFFRWKDTPNEKLLVQLAKDFEAMDILATEFLVDGGTLSLLATDMTGNACVFAYEPKSVASWKGQKLMIRSAFHVGSPVHRMVRFKLKPSGGDGAEAAGANRHAVFFGTLDGSLGILVPIEQQTHAALLRLQRHLETATVRPAGLNSRTYRAPKTQEGRVTRPPAPHALLDGETLAEFERLSWRAQASAAEAAGMTRREALSHLHRLSARTAFM